MATTEELRESVGILRSNCLHTITDFVDNHPNIPAQAVMIGLGELLIQFSVSQVGKAHTLHLLAALRDAVHNFAEQIATQH